jgi:hypothetical protein
MAWVCGNINIIPGFFFRVTLENYWHEDRVHCTNLEYKSLYKVSIRKKEHLPYIQSS